MVTVWLALALTLSSANPGRLEFQRAAKLYAKGRYEAALPWFEKAYEQSGHRPATIFGLARCERMLGDFDSAEGHLEEFLAVAPLKDQLRGRKLLAEVRAEQAKLKPKPPTIVRPPAPSPPPPLATAPAPPPWVAPKPAPAPKQESGSVFTEPLFWIISGAVVAAGAVTAGVLASQSGSEPYGGTSGEVFRP